MPYLLDLCVDSPTQCYMNQYKDYAFTQLELVEAAGDVSRNKYIDIWTKEVTKKFDLDKEQLMSLYTASDRYDTN